MLITSDKERRNLDFIRRRVREAIPAQVLTDNANLDSFINAYYDYLWQENNVGLSEKIKNISAARDPDESEFLTQLKSDLAKDFPSTTSVDDRTLLRMLYLFYLSKGSTEAIETYFKVFLNTTNVEVLYPKDNMLRTSDGKWNNDEQRFENTDGFLSESSIVLQDSFYFQLYSYVIKSGVSIIDWGNAFQKLVHPAGWEFFGEVELLGEAFFKEGIKSPTVQPCNVTPDARILIVSAAFTSPPSNVADKHMRVIMPSTGVEFSEYKMEVYRINILGASNVFLHDVNDLTFEDFENDDLLLDIRRGSVITTTTT